MLLRFAANVIAQHWPDLEITTAKRGAEGIARAQSTRPDLILLDFVLPDLLGDEVCVRLHQTAETSDTPVVVMGSGSSETREIEKRHPNVVRTINKPFTPELLVATLRSLFEDQIASRVTPLIRIRERLQLPEVVTTPSGKNGLAPRQVVMRGDTGAFSLRAILHAIREGKLSGCLRLFGPKGRPVEVYTQDGSVVLATMRDAIAYREYAGELCATLSPVVIETTVQGQADSGCPFPLLLSLRESISQHSALQWTDRLGQVAFAPFWVGARANFEFEILPVFPDWLSRYDGRPTDVDDWISATLRCIGPDVLGEPSHEILAGVPAYTRSGYEFVQQLNLTDLEREFAGAVNGITSLSDISAQLGLPHAAAHALLFRFRALEAMELWPAGVISNGSPAAPVEEKRHEELVLDAMPDPEIEKHSTPAAESFDEHVPDDEPDRELASRPLGSDEHIPDEKVAKRSALRAAPPRPDFVALTAIRPVPRTTRSGELVPEEQARREIVPEMPPERATSRIKITTPRITQMLTPAVSDTSPVGTGARKFGVRVT